MGITRLRKEYLGYKENVNFVNRMIYFNGCTNNTIITSLTGKSLLQIQKTSICGERYR
eukprot:UN02284